MQFDHRSLIYGIIGTQERNLASQDKLAIKIRAIEFLLYLAKLLLLLCAQAGLRVCRGLSMRRSSNGSFIINMGVLIGTLSPICQPFLLKSASARCGVFCFSFIQSNFNGSNSSGTNIRLFSSPTFSYFFSENSYISYFFAIKCKIIVHTRKS